MLRIYPVGAGQTLYVDTGEYRLLYPLVVSNAVGWGQDDEGFRMTGPSDHTATLRHASPYTVATVLELDDADYVTLERLSLVADRRVGPQRQHGFRGPPFDAHRPYPGRDPHRLGFDGPQRAT